MRITVDRIAEQPALALSAAAGDAELMVLGPRGLSGLTGFLIGCVAFSVVSRTDRSVVSSAGRRACRGRHVPDSSGAASMATAYRCRARPGPARGPRLECAVAPLRLRRCPRPAARIKARLTRWLRPW
ncbi:hypothetical protein DMH25_01760 [Streptomyces sp. WAC 01325]|nr:hypothetical protein DMH25_01760 [Streptomyces sp. WAC 01325]